MLPLFFMITSVGWSCPVANLTNELWAVRTVETYVKPTIANTQCLQLVLLPILDSNRTVPLLCPPPPLHPKLDLTNLIVNSLFTWNPNQEEQFTDQLCNARKECHGKSLEGRPCSRFLSCSAFLKEVVSSSVHLLVECLEALHRVVADVSGHILDPGFQNDMRTFKEKFMGVMRTHNPRMTPTVHVLVHHVPKYVRRTGV